MSHVACNYVKKLKAAPSGEVISVQERAVLWYLADCHNEETGGVAWPAVSTLADYHDMTARNMRKVLAQIESKGLIGKIGRKRDNGSHQSNLYFFVELGHLSTPEVPETTLLKACGKRTKNGAKAVKKAVKAGTPTLSPTTVPPGHPRQEDTVTHDRETLSPTTALEPTKEPELETAEETAVSPNPPGGCDDGYSFSGKEQTLKAKTARANSSTPSQRPPWKWVDPPAANEMVAKPSTLSLQWGEFKAEMLRQIDKLPEKLRAGALEVYDDRIAMTELADASCEGDTLIPTWTVTSPDKERTEAGLDLLKIHVKSALWKAAKGNVNLRVVGGYL